MTGCSGSGAVPLPASGVVVTADSEAGVEAAVALAAELGLAVRYPGGAAAPAPYILVYTAAGLQLEAQGGRSKPLRIDFSSGEMRYRRLHGANRSSLLARAVGAKHAHDAPAVLDATAGLGRDAFVLALLGCRVRMHERSAVLWALLRDALARAAQDPELAEIAGHLSLQHVDARHCLHSLAGQAGRPAVVYLDPMFPLGKRCALVKREMRLCRELVGDDQDADALFAAALASGIPRIVVKRMRGAPVLGQREPQLTFASDTCRFDVYLGLA